MAGFCPRMMMSLSDACYAWQALVEGRRKGRHQEDPLAISEKSPFFSHTVAFPEHMTKEEKKNRTRMIVNYLKIMEGRSTES